jgi:hypothetical protein
VFLKNTLVKHMKNDRNREHEFRIAPSTEKVLPPGLSFCIG